MAAQYLYIKNISENSAFYYEFGYIHVCANCNHLFLGP